VNNNLPSEAIAHAVDVLKNEEVIAYPTEAVFGVGCDPDSETAVMPSACLETTSRRERADFDRRELRAA
jgi:tRNA A37 threonylcarbamoyladenosine synthetase subunit TsaC/SUA5/YrdC